MSSDAVLSVSHVSKCYEIYAKPSHRLWQMIFAGRRTFYREFWALRDVSFDVRRGECVGIIGLNGAGKSTLLQIITGTLRPTSGEVRTSGRVAALLELGSGFNPEFSGRDNIYLNAAILGLTKEETDARYDDILAFADIGDFISQPLKTYSSGMQLRLAFAVQVILEPEILIIDEALSVGDMFFQQKCMARLKKLLANGTTVLFVSHDIAAVKSLCSRAVYLKRGVMAACGPAKDVAEMYQNDTTVNAFSSEPGLPGAEQKANAGEPPLFHADPELPRRVTDRSGSGDVKIVGFDVLDMNNRRISDCYVDDEIRLVLSLQADRSIPAGAQIGVLCRDERGNDIFATNLVNYALFLPELRAGQKAVVSWSFRIPVFGLFFFSCGIKPEEVAPVFYDRPFNVASLRTIRRNRNDRVTSLLSIPPCNFELEIR